MAQEEIVPQKQKEEQIALLEIADEGCRTHGKGIRYAYRRKNEYHGPVFDGGRPVSLGHFLQLIRGTNRALRAIPEDEFGVVRPGRDGQPNEVRSRKSPLQWRR